MFKSLGKKQTVSQAEIEPPKHWYVYIVRCLDSTLYTGVTLDVADMVRAINIGQGPQYTQARCPVFLVHHEEFMNETDAEERANEIRHLNRNAKEILLSELVVGALEV
jgi:putative endonuclease